MAFEIGHGRDIAERKFLRASIIPYVQVGEVNCYALFVDARFIEITDPGGGAKQSEQVFGEAARELYEESLGLFDIRDQTDRLADCVCYFQPNRVFFMCKFEIESSEMRLKPAEFRRRYEAEVLKLAVGSRAPFHHVENCFMLWVSEPVLKALSARVAVPLPELGYYTERDGTLMRQMRDLTRRMRREEFGVALYNRFFKRTNGFGPSYPRLWDNFQQLTAYVYGVKDTLA